MAVMNRCAFQPTCIGAHNNPSQSGREQPTDYAETVTLPVFNCFLTLTSSLNIGLIMGQGKPPPLIPITARRIKIIYIHMCPLLLANTSLPTRSPSDLRLAILICMYVLKSQSCQL